MFKKLIHRFILPKHYWRDIEFDELSELYTSMMFRSLALNLVGIFVPIYLYQRGYQVWEILFFFAAFFAAHVLTTYPAAQSIAKIGPKHTIAISYIFLVTSLLLLVTLPIIDWPLLLIAATFGPSNCLFFMAYNVDFSKVKHSEHGGKEVGWMYSMERLGAILGPITGGVIAYFFGAEYIFIAAVVLLFAGILPMLATKEPTATNQKLDFGGLKVSEIKRDMIAQAFFQTESTITIILWPLFVSIYIFRDNPYVQLGTITSLSVFVSIFIARAIGRTIDKNKGRPLLRLGAILNAILHAFRPFTHGFTSALGINMANEAVTPSYRMPFFKGLFDAADDMPGRRIVYLAAIEVSGSSARALFYVFATALAYFASDAKWIFIVLFFAGSLVSLGIMTEKFKALNPR